MLYFYLMVRRNGAVDADTSYNFVANIEALKYTVQEQQNTHN